ncbi:hypothetical protein C5167_026951 [Papaver somniferum]|nr:hypothetical protein C5167_026951 [Papaver somniferum]
MDFFASGFWGAATIGLIQGMQYCYGNTRRSKLVCIGAKTYYLVLVSNGGPNWGVASKCWF